MLNGKTALKGIRSAISIKRAVLSDFRTAPAPLFMVWEATYSCNLDCPYCYLEGLKNSAAPVLDTAGIMHVIAEARRFGLFCLVVTGGEPLLRDDIFEVREYAAGLGLIVSLTTNGTMIRQSNIADVSKFDHVTISADSVHEECRAGACGPRDANISWVKSLVKELRGRSPGIMVNVQTVIDENNWPHLLDINREFHDTSIDTVFQLRYGNRFEIDRDRWNGMIRRMRYRNAPLGWMQKRALGLFPGISRGESRSPCLALTSNFVVSPEGDLLACNYRRKAITSLRNGRSLGEIWDDLGDLRRRHSSDLRGCTCANTCFLPPAMLLS